MIGLDLRFVQGFAAACQVSACEICGASVKADSAEDGCDVPGTPSPANGAQADESSAESVRSLFHRQGGLQAWHRTGGEQGACHPGGEQRHHHHGEQ